jgi:hypothetical protein
LSILRRVAQPFYSEKKAVAPSCVVIVVDWCVGWFKGVGWFLYLSCVNLGGQGHCSEFCQSITGEMLSNGPIPGATLGNRYWHNTKQKSGIERVSMT